MQQLTELTAMPILPLAMAAAGLLIRFIVGRQRFRRRGIGGLQHFSSYTRALAITLLERLAMLLANLLLLLAAGIGIWKYL